MNTSLKKFEKYEHYGYVRPVTNQPASLYGAAKTHQFCGYNAALGYKKGLFLLISYVVVDYDFD